MLRAVFVAGILIASPTNSYYFSYQSWLAENDDARAAYIAGAFDSFVFYYDTDEGHDNNEYYRSCVERLRLKPRNFSAELSDFGSGQRHLHTGTVQAMIVAYLIKTCGRYSATGQTEAAGAGLSPT